MEQPHIIGVRKLCEVCGALRTLDVKKLWRNLPQEFMDSLFTELSPQQRILHFPCIDCSQCLQKKSIILLLGEFVDIREVVPNSKNTKYLTFSNAYFYSSYFTIFF